MRTLTISKDRVLITVFEQEGYYDLGSLECAFGNVIDMLESEFPVEEIGYSKVEYLVKISIDGLNDKCKAKNIWGMHENGAVMYTIYEFLGERKSLSVSWQDVEKLRINNCLTTNYLPINHFDYDKGMEFRDVKSVIEVVYCMLYYYAYYNMKLVKCQHCGRWFATKTLKEKYCKRISPCFGKIITGKVPLNCEATVRNIIQKQKRRHANIYIYLYNYAKDQNSIDDFLVKSQDYKYRIQSEPTVSNFLEYEAFLDNYPKRIKKTED